MTKKPKLQIAKTQQPVCDGIAIRHKCCDDGSIMWTATAFGENGKCLAHVEHDTIYEVLDMIGGFDREANEDFSKLILEDQQQFEKHQDEKMAELPPAELAKRWRNLLGESTAEDSNS